MLIVRHSSKTLFTLTFIFAWLPAMAFSVLCGAMLLGMLFSIIDDLLSAKFEQAFVLLFDLLFMTFALLGFWGLSSVTFSRIKLSLPVRMLFIILGIVASVAFTTSVWLKHASMWNSSGNLSYIIVGVSFLP